MIDYDLATLKKIKKIDAKIDEFRKKIKNSDDLKVTDEVLDSFTLKALYKLASKGYLDAMGGHLSTGKEANVFYAIKNQDIGHQELAIKIFRISNSNFKAMQEYLISDVRFQNIKHSKKDIILAWTLKEFRNLNRAREAGLNVPEPIIVERNILVMEFLGREQIPFIQLRGYDLNDQQAASIYDKTKDFIVRLYRDAKLVHGDMSEYNILLDPDSLNPVFIDMGQSVTLDHLNATEFLHRDITNIARFFGRFHIDVDVEKLLTEIIQTRTDQQ